MVGLVSCLVICTGWILFARSASCGLDLISSITTWVWVHCLLTAGTPQLTTLRNNPNVVDEERKGRHTWKHPMSRKKSMMNQTPPDSSDITEGKIPD